MRMGKKILDSPEQVGKKHNIFVNRLANLLMGDLNQGYDNQQSSEEVVVSKGCRKMWMRQTFKTTRHGRRGK